MFYQQQPAFAAAIPFVKFLRCLAVARGDVLQAAAYGEGRHDLPTSVQLALKAAVAAGSMGNTDYSSLSEVQALAREFMPLLRTRELIGRIADWRRVPQKVSLLRTAGAPEADFVGEGDPVPVQRFTLERDTITVAKIASIVVMTNEVIRSGKPEADALMAVELANALAARSDRALLDPASGALVDKRPASITNGISAINSAGTSLANVRTDLRALFNGYAGDLATAVLVMTPATAANLALLDSTFANVGARGGSIAGVPCFTSVGCESPSSPVSRQIVLFDPSQIMLADEGVSVAVSEGGSVQMDDAPATGAQNLVSLFQQNLAAMKGTRYVSWKRANDGAVRYISGVAY
jgi:HK97 family phage major capsid protein